MNTPAIFAERLTKLYGAKTALDLEHFEAHAGEIYALLGANGSGKSTLIRILAGGLRPTSGRYQLTGSTGYVAQNFALYDDLPVEENIRFMARLYGLSGRALSQLVDGVLDRLELTPMRRERASSLSHGWKQRLALAAALCHNPAILLLDEATAGIDPVARHSLWNILSDCARSGMAVVLATHHVDEAANAHRIGYLRAGRLAFSGTPAELPCGGHAFAFGAALASMPGVIA